MRTSELQRYVFIYLAKNISALVIIILFGLFWFPLSRMINAVFGLWFVLIIPGFSWTFVFRDKQSISSIERTILSIALSIIFVPLIMYFFKLFGYAPSKSSVLFSSLCISLAGFVCALFKYKFLKNKINSGGSANT